MNEDDRRGLFSSMIAMITSPIARTGPTGEAPTVAVATMTIATSTSIRPGLALCGNTVVTKSRSKVGFGERA